MIAFLKELRLAKDARVDLRRDFIWVLRLMLAIPAPDRLDVSAEVIEELAGGSRQCADRTRRKSYPPCRAARGG